MADTHYSNVSLLVHGDSAFTDFSASPKTITPVAGAVISVTQSKFGGASMYFDGASYASTPMVAALNLEGGDFTLETHAFFSDYPALSGGQYRSALISADGPATRSYELAVMGTSSSLTALVFTYFAGGVYTVTGSYSFSLSTWYHLAASRVGNTVYLFVDGVLVGSSSISGSIDTSTQLLCLGAGAYGGAYPFYLRGHLDEVRVTKGVGRYSSSFTPPTAAYDDFASDTGAAALTCPATGFTSYCGGAVALAPPSARGYSGVAGSASVALLCPTPKQAMFSGGAVVLLPQVATLSFAARDTTGVYATQLFAPSATLTVTTGARATGRAPSPACVVGGSVTTFGTLVLAAPRSKFTAAGVSAESAGIRVKAPSPNLVGFAGAVLSVSTFRGSHTLSATGTTGGLGQIRASCPLFALAAAGSAQNYGRAELLAPGPELGRTLQAWLIAPGAKLTVVGSAVVTATYEAYAVNLRHTDEKTVNEVTRYTNFPFTHIVRYKNSYYGANSSGLYLLEGTTDDGADIPWAVKTGTSDFGSPNKKTIAAVFIGGRFGPDATVKLHAGEKTPSTYSFTTPRGQLAQNYRQTFGKGVRERYHSLEVGSVGACSIDTLELDIHETTRRI